MENAGWVAGPGLFGLVLLLGAPVAGGGLAATACFLIALLVVGRCSTPGPAAAADDPGEPDDLMAGVRAVRSSRRIRAVLAVAVLDNFLYGFLVVGIVLLAQRALGTGDSGVGALNAAFAVGAFASMAVAPVLGRREDPARPMLMGMLAFIGITALLAAADSTASAAAIVFLCGLLTLTVEITAVTLMQQMTPRRFTARVFGVYDTLAVAAVSAGSALAGVLSDAWGVRTALVATCLGSVLVAVAAAPSLVRGGGVLTAGLNLPDALPEEDLCGTVHPAGDAPGPCRAPAAQRR